MGNNNQAETMCANEQALKASHSSSTLVHELRNPLTNIILSAKELMSNEKYSIDDEIKTYLDIILRGATQINKIISMLLLSKGPDVMEYEEHSIHQLLEEVLELTEDRIRLKHIEVSRDYETKDCKTAMNVPEMKMALTNIIINAIDAMAIEHGLLRVAIKSTTEHFVIQIEDNGCGISKENLENIFKPYFTNKPGGLGIGLAATYEILRSNHVGVNVESEEGKGTCFMLLFDRDHQQAFRICV